MKTMQLWNILMGAVIISVFIALTAATPAQAQIGDFGAGASDQSLIFTRGENIVDSTFKGGEKIIYGVGGLGAIALGALAFFGRFQWGWFFGLCGGLALVAAITLIIQFIAGNNVQPYQ